MIRALRGEVLLQQVVRDGLVVVAISRDLVSLPHPRVQAFFLLQANCASADVLTPLDEVIVLLVFGIGQRFEELTEASDSADIFRRSGPLTL